MTPESDTPRELRRPRDGRMVAGVAQGIADYFGASPALVRLAFVALAFVGGAGVALYLIAALVVPDDGADDSIAEQFVERHRHRPVLLAGAGVAATLAVVLLWVPGDAGAIALLVLGSVIVAEVIRRDRAARHEGERTS